MPLAFRLNRDAIRPLIFGAALAKPGDLVGRAAR
jgi:hypothetical protein